MIKKRKEKRTLRAKMITVERGYLVRHTFYRFEGYIRNVLIGSGCTTGVVESGGSLLPGKPELQTGTV